MRDRDNFYDPNFTLAVEKTAHEEVERLLFKILKEREPVENPQHLLRHDFHYGFGPDDGGG